MRFGTFVRELKNDSLKVAKERNCTQNILVTEKDRIAACSFYEKNLFSKNTIGHKKRI